MKVKKVWIMVICCAMATAAFSACGKAGAEGGISQPSSFGNDPTQSSSGEENIDDNSEGKTSISFKEFMENHSDKALSFAETYIKASIVEDKTPLSQTWAFNANDEDELSSVSLTYTYSSSETERIIEVATASITNPIDLDDIVSGEFTTQDTAHEVTREIAFEFDAKDFYLNEDIANALFSISGQEGTVKYYKEETTLASDKRVFKVAEETSSALNIYTITLSCESDAEVIENIQAGTYESVQSATYPLGDKNSTTIQTEKYEQEEFTPENVDEAVNDYSAEIISALDTYFLDIAGKKTLGNSFDKYNLLRGVWDIGEGETISEIKFIADYAKSETSYMYSVGRITLKNPINVKQLNKDNIDTIIKESVDGATYARDYSFSYNPTIQGTRDNLVNEIFEAYGMTNECPEGAVRYFVDKGAAVSTELQCEIRQFKVVEITDSKVTEFSINIKTSTSDEGFIENLGNSNNYSFYDEKSASMEGTKLESVEVARIAVSAKGE